MIPCIKTPADLTAKLMDAPIENKGNMLWGSKHQKVKKTTDWNAGIEEINIGKKNVNKKAPKEKVDQ